MLVVAGAMAAVAKGARKPLVLVVASLSLKQAWKEKSSCLWSFWGGFSQRKGGVRVGKRVIHCLWW